MFLSYAQNGEDAMLWRALGTVQQGAYIDVGAFDPDRESVTRAFYERGWRGINIEPVKEAFLRLCERRPFDINLNTALGAAPGESTLFRVADTGLSTLDALQAREHQCRGWEVEARATPVTTLEEVCRRHATETIHFLKIDCEGSERAVLEGADFTAFRPWIVLIEATRPTTQEPTHGLWEDLLEAADYRFVWFDGLNRFYLAGEHHDRLRRHFETPLNIFDAVRKAAPPPPNRPLRPGADPFEAAQAPFVDERQRTAMTARCRDADTIAKVEGAGQVRTQADGERVQIMHNGLKVPADGYCGPWMTHLIEMCRGHHEPQEERVFHEVVSRLPKTATMIELGGWWAFYSAWFLRGCPGRRAVVLEPDPAHRAIGERTMSLNGLQAEFIDGYVAREPKAPAPFATDDSGEIILPGCSVPQLMAERDIGMLDVLHCDTQGAELAVLESCRDLFARGRINWVFISTHAHQITGDPLTHQRCLALLRDSGAIIEAEHDVHESFSGDGLIVARFGPAPADWRPVKLSFNRYSESLFRNPAYDLARELRKGPSRDAIERMVEAIYKVLLLRSPDPGGLMHHSDRLERTGDFDALLNGVLRSKEFQVRRAAFSQRYFNQREVAGAKYFAADGPLVCCGLNFALGRDGPLGKCGESLNVPLDSMMLPAVFTRGAWDPHAIEFIVERLAPDEVYTLVDIGANIGLFSRQILNASVQVQGVYCVEPDARNFAALTANLAAYRDRNLRLFNFALGLNDGDATFYRDNENFGNYSLNKDAMRDRPFETASVAVAATRRWMDATLPREGNLIWKSDTQGHDELIVGHTPWEVWNRVRVAMIELWRIEKPDLDRGDFLDKIESFPNRRLGANLSASTQDVETYLSSTDWTHTDLYLWR